MTSSATNARTDKRQLGERVAEAVRTSRRRLSYDARRHVIGELAARILQRRPELSGLERAQGAAFLAAFLQPDHLERLLASEIQVECLRGFARDAAQRERRLVPRGVVCHWIAGNVPLLGIFSWAISTILGNVNVVRVSSRQDDLLTPLLHAMASFGVDGEQMSKETVVVQFDRNDEATHREMSALADVRIAWGGREAVESIASLPCKWETDTIVLGPRVSMAVVDPAAASTKALTRLATDIAYFDQQACSSPQVVFVKGQAGDPAFDGLVKELSLALSTQTRLFPRHELDFGETYRIALDRARVAIAGGGLHRDKGTQWTVAQLERPMDDVRCANRFVQLVPFATVAEVLPWIPKNVQSAVLALTEEDAASFTEEAAHLGVCRFPKPGQGNFFETPWDGTPLAARLVRWIVRSVIDRDVPGPPAAAGGENQERH